MPPPSLRMFQRQFADRLLAPATGTTRPAGARVYADNVRFSLRAALQNAYPVVHALVGGRYFAQLADMFVRRHPPQQGWLSAYGSGFAEFLDGEPSARSLPYLADIARIEWARVRAATFALADGLDLVTLATQAPEALMDLRLCLPDVATLICSDHPIFAIWQAHATAEPDLALAAIDEGAPGETVVVARTDARAVSVILLSAGDAAFLSAVVQQAPLAQCWTAALTAQNDFDLGSTLSRLNAWHVLATAPPNLPQDPIYG